jgi:xanthine permease XanP
VKEVLGTTQPADLDLGIHLLVAVLTLAIAIGASIWGRGVVKLMCTFLGLLAGVLASVSCGLISEKDIASIISSPIFRLPSAGYISYAFDPGLAPAFIAAGLAATLRTVGVVTTCQRINNAAWTHPDMANIRKGILADGLGCAISGLIGSTGMNIGPSLVSVSSLIGATSRVIAYATAFFLIVFALLPPLAAAVLVPPPEVAGAILVFTGSVMITSGMQVMLSRPPDRRGAYVIGVSVVMALSRRAFPEYFAKLPILIQSFAANELAVGLITALLLTLIFRIGTKRWATFRGHCSPGDAGLAEKFITETARSWSVRPQVAADCVRVVHGILKHINVECLCDGLIRLSMSYDGLDLGVDMRYDGRAISPRLVRPKTTPIPVEPTDDEEAAAQSGLQDFLRATEADWSRVIVKDGFVHIRLRFAA